MRKVIEVKALAGYILKLKFDDGVTGSVDLSHLAGKGVFAIWSEAKTFEQVRIGPSGELMWGDRVDLCPDSLYFKATGKKEESAGAL